MLPYSPVGGKIMTRTVGTTARGIRTPIIREGDNLVEIVVDSIRKCVESENIQLRDKDVVGITESLVARAQGNFVSVDDIAADIKSKFDGEIAVTFPILSRNRFSLILKGILKAVPKVYLILKYPSDEVGNPLMDEEKMDSLGIKPYTDVLSETDYRKLFGPEVKHPFTGIDYVEMYRNMGSEEKLEIYLANDPKVALNFTDDVLTADIHTRHRTKRILKAAGARKVYSLDQICTSPVRPGCGYNPESGLLGSNKATEDTVKLFPRDGQQFVDEVQKRLKEISGKNIEVLIYGDGAFKDPVGKIWELADPVVSPAYTAGLAGTPNEIKLKYLADNKLKELDGQDVNEAIRKCIKEKKSDFLDQEEAQGTTPRQLTDLLGSLCDLTSGSGDKGTPIVLVQGYFDNYATD